MSDFVWNICLWKWYRREVSLRCPNGCRYTWRVRLGWARAGHTPAGWRPIAGHLFWTQFAVEGRS